MISISEPQEAESVHAEWRALQSEHAMLAACAERLEALLGSLAAGASGGSETRALLEEFHTLLFDHFAKEEESGKLDRAAAAQPGLQRRVERVKLEHGDLRERMRALASRAAASDWAYSHSHFVALRRDLRNHEREESEVLQLAYLEDVGGRG